MTKRFALADTLPDPYFTIDAGAEATLAVKIGPCGEGRVTVEVWRGEIVLCRLLARSARLAEEPQPPATSEQEGKRDEKQNVSPRVVSIRNRARELGQRKALSLAVRNNQSRKRYSGLLGSLKQTTRPVTA